LLPHTWSLAVEEHFYLLLPLVLIACAKASARSSGSRGSFATLPQVVFWVALACLSLRCITATNVGRFDPYEHLFPTHLRIDALLFGVVLASLWHGGSLAGLRTARRRLALGLGGVALLLPAFAIEVETSWFVHTFGLTLFFVGSGAILIAVVDVAATGRVLRSLAFVGAHSYSIYLWHIPMRVGCDRLLADVAAPARLAIYVAGSIALGIVMSRVVEFPVLRLRDRWFPSRASATPDAAPTPPAPPPPTSPRAPTRDRSVVGTSRATSSSSR
jgi:peptidoglycan/LPS O-acetylase OafA/YrhL